MVSGDGRRYVPMRDLETFADAGIALVNGGLGAPSGIDAGQQQNDHKTLVAEHRSSLEFLVFRSREARGRPLNRNLSRRTLDHLVPVVDRCTSPQPVPRPPRPAAARARRLDRAGPPRAAEPSNDDRPGIFRPKRVQLSTTRITFEETIMGKGNNSHRKEVKKKKAKDKPKPPPPRR